MTHAPSPLAEVLPEILHHWQTLAIREPWRRLPSGDHLHQLGELLRPLLHATGGAAGGEDSDDGIGAAHWHLAYTRCAAEIGRRRRDDGVPREALFGDFHLLRQAAWETLRDRLPGPTATDAILRIDVAISVCTRAALLGYHQRELGPLERWEGLVVEAAHASPLWPGDGTPRARRDGAPGNDGAPRDGGEHDDGVAAAR